MKRKKEIWHMTVMLAALSGLVALCSVFCITNEGELFTIKSFEPNTIDAERQVIWVKVDSLNTLLEKLPDDKVAFEDRGDKLSFVALDKEEFNRLLLDQSYLTSYKELKTPYITIMEDGFEATVKTENQIRYVQLPAEIISSLQHNLLP